MIIVRIIGGLGNQMFQYALYKSLEERQLLTKVDILSFERYHLHNGYELERIFKKIRPNYATLEESRLLADSGLDLLSKLKRKILGIKRTHYKESSLSFNDDIIGSSVEMYFDGYWQSEKYFKNIESVIREEFTFQPFHEERNIEIEKKMQQSNSVSIHIRRGDYLNNRLYAGICTEEYYSKAIRYIKNYIDNPYFFVFSDDIEWCKAHLNLINRAEYIDWNMAENSYRDMQLMSMCKHNIIANSTFSWWGAWLNDNPEKIVIAPSRILNSVNDVVDLIPDDWLKIDNKGELK